MLHVAEGTPSPRPGGVLLTSGEAIQARRPKLPRDRTDCSAELPPEPDLAAPESALRAFARAT
jgi:hypothetical protein